TLQSIARSAYGDSALWFRIAEANGLSSDRDLRVGQTLNIPNKAAGVHNDGSVFKPYDPSKVVGDTTPNLPMPSDGGGGCGVVGSIITMVVVIVVAYFTQQYYLVNYGTVAAGGGAAVAGGGTVVAGSAAAGSAVTYTAGSMAIAGAIGGVAGAAAGQLAGMAMGMQNGFDWRAVALGGLGGAIAGGLSSVNFVGNGIGNAAVRGVLTSAVTQGIGVATGLQQSFNWKSVAAAGIGAAAGAATGQALGNRLGTDDLGQFAKGVLSSLAAGTTTAVARGGRVDVATIATDAFGNALVSSLAGQSSSTSSSQEDVLGQKIAELQRSPIWNDPVAPSTDVLGDKIAELQRSPVWSDAPYTRPDALMPSIVPTPQVVARGVTADGRAFERWDSGTTAYAVPSPVLGGQELPPLSKDQLTTSALGSSVTGSTFGDRLLGGAVGGGQASFGLVNGMVRMAGNTVLQIGDILTFGLNHDSPIIQQAWVEQGALAAGVVRLATEPRAVVSEAIESVANNYRQAQALDDKGDAYGAAVIRARQTGEIAGAVLGGAQAAGDLARLGGVAWRTSGLPDWNVKFADYVPNTLYSNPLELLKFEPVVPNISRVDLGEFLGRGGNKDVYAYGDNQAVGVLRTGKNPQTISAEIDMLGKLSDAGIPTVNPRAVSVDGAPGMLMDRFAQGSKEVVRLVESKMTTVGESALLNQKSVADLQAIRGTMVSKQIQINDLQFLISREGRVVVSDPLGVNFNTAPSRNNLRMIDLLMRAAQKNGAN
ncbi:LysM peptidoglycan-binding domain-containing protein, partial [Ralstonia flaminis]